VDTANQIYLGGSLKGAGEKSKFTHVPLPNEALLETYACGRSSILAMSQDQKFYWIGKNKHAHFQDANLSTDKFLPMTVECAPRPI
jgi:hypothetical protein